MSWVTERPGGASPITVTSAAPTAWPSDGLRIVSPTIAAGGALGVAPGGGWPSGPGNPPGTGRVSRPKAIRPTITKTAAMTTGGIEIARRSGIVDGGLALAAAGEVSPRSTSEMDAGASESSGDAPTGSAATPTLGPP